MNPGDAHRTNEKATPSGPLSQVVPDVACLAQPIVNVYFVGVPGAGDRGWVLVDAGLPFCASKIVSAAEHRFGTGARPSAIVMTHGHFDHVGALEELADRWDVPVYAHELELPYLTGRSSYPPPDPSVGGGAMSWLSFLYPHGPVDVSAYARLLPADGSLPGMPGWRWLHTPGHAPGHVALFRENDGLLLAGDAFVTTQQESAIQALTKPRHVRRPPAYYTTNWVAARLSVELLADIQPTIAATGHGKPMRGDELRDELRVLAADFDQIAVPSHGRYVDQPALSDERGVVSVPPAPSASPVLGGMAFAATMALFLAARKWRAQRAEARST
ncbi:MAG: MBL fold metallo-hydrolase [Thermomicrobiales bacterium]|nr:MBL fold metallo-hydrolase [Thermomicrobiales bacterium]